MSSEVNNNYLPKDSPSNTEINSETKPVETKTFFRYVKKRDGKIHEFNKDKIVNAIFKAARSVGGEDRATAQKLADKVVAFLIEKFQSASKIPHIEEIQDAIEKVLI
ncbi:MAG: ATP cone domain-containing protein, partial [candidate division WOR-3 bacterium]|nr:ATP cone domain-containing protein [candidate division WOR-3 bacterium]